MGHYSQKCVCYASYGQVHPSKQMNKENQNKNLKSKEEKYDNINNTYDNSSIHVQFEYKVNNP